MRKWMERQCGRANLPPAVVALGGVIALAITVYIYRHIIIETLITLLEAIGLLAVLLGAIAIAVNAVRWNRRRTKAAIEGELRSHGVLAPGPDADQAAMSTEADWLAAPGTELAWSPDGKSLVARDDKDAAS